MAKDVLRHERSNLYRFSSIDGASCSLVVDNFSEKLQLNLSRLDLNIISEEIENASDGKFTSIIGSIPASEKVRSVEFTADLRPDIAYLIASSLISTLNNLPEDRKKRYGITSKNLPPFPPLVAP